MYKEGAPMRPTALFAVLLLACGASTDSTPSSPSAPADPPTPPSTPDEPSSGCGRWTLARGVTNGRIQVGGVGRTFVLAVPPSAAGPLPVVFAFHGMGSNGKDYRDWQVWMKLESSAAGPTIFVYPDALPDSDGQTGWGDTDGRDVAFFDALLAKLEAEACVNRSRVFVTGFSYGGFMSNNLGCKRAGVVRAIAPLSGGAWWGACNGRRVAVWMATGDQDGLLPQSLSARDQFRTANQCGATTAAVEPSPCVAYAGCAAGAPVVWCQFSGDHTVQSWEPPALMRFFDGLP